ncbi:MAG: hypothetical protein AAF713_02920 [Pseudomonadota bacterium]
MGRSIGMVCALVLVALFSGRAAAQDVLDGRYLGVGDATGAAIEIQPEGDGFEGRFEDSSGGRQTFDADRLGEVAETLLDMDDRTVLMRITPLPFGAEVLLVPLDPDGNLVTDAARVESFVREGLEIPEPGEGFVAEPADGTTRITGNSFVASYEFWSPRGVRNGFLALPPRFRTVIRLFPAVQLDVIWKLCLAPDGDQALSLALRGQGVNCQEVIEGVANAQRSGSFEAYKAEVSEQRAVLLISVRCADGYRMSKTECDEAAQHVSQAAISLQTAATVLGRYR